jgi:cell shape-determining protein MreD
MNFFKRNPKEFRPDREGTGQLNKLWPTPRQQLRMLQWLMYTAVCLVGLLAQDAVLYRVNILGGCTDLVPCLILMVAVMRGAESGSVFALVLSVLYFFSGSSAGFYVIPLLTVVAVFVAIFRQAFLRQGLPAIALCAGLGMLLYELGLFLINLFLGLTVGSRIGAALLTALLSLLAVPVFYPVLQAIGKLGGQIWKE